MTAWVVLSGFRKYPSDKILGRIGPMKKGTPFLERKRGKSAG